MGFLKSIFRDINKEFDEMKDFGPFSYGVVNCYIYELCSCCQKQLLGYSPNDWVIGERSVESKCRECRDKDEYENNWKKSIYYNLHFKNPEGAIESALRGEDNRPEILKKRRLHFIAFNNLASKHSLNWFDFFVTLRNTHTWIATSTNDEKIIEDIKYNSPYNRYGFEDRYEILQNFYQEGPQGSCPECSMSLRFNDEYKEKYPEWFCDDEDKCWNCRFPKNKHWHHHANLDDDIGKIGILTEKLKKKRTIFNTV